MKKLSVLLALTLLSAACSDSGKEAENAPLSENQAEKQTVESGETIVVKPEYDVKYEETTYSYAAGALPAQCDKGSDIICAIEQMAKCTIDPKQEECLAAKLPKFVFMPDEESLQRPSEMSFRVTKIKPVSADMIEVYTESSCNGVWFGLCKGNIIYVLSNKSGKWVVKDVYARE